MDPSVLHVDAEPIPPLHGDAFDITRFGARAHVITDSRGKEILLLCDGPRQIQLNIRSGSVRSGPARLRYHLKGFTDLDAKTSTMMRLNAFLQKGRFPKYLFPPNKVATKWAKALQAYDGLCAGASYREIAAVVFSPKMAREDWTARSDYLRLRTQRLLRYGRQMVGGAYLNLLR